MNQNLKYHYANHIKFVADICKKQIHGELEAIVSNISDKVSTVNSCTTNMHTSINFN